MDTSFSFELDSEVYVYRSCGVQFKGNFYVYGSSQGDQRQIAKLIGCSLQRIATLPFTHHTGACAPTSDQVFLCFDDNGDGRTCHVSNEPTGPFRTIPKSIHSHRSTRSAANDSKSIFTTKRLFLFQT